MSIWFVFLGLTFIAFVAGIIYLVKQVAKFNFIHKLSRGNKRLGTLFSGLIIVLVIGIVYLLWGFINAMIVLLHFVLFHLLISAIAWLCTKIFHPVKTRIYYVGIISVTLTVIYLAVGFYLAHNVWITTYELTTDKKVPPLRIALIADSHVGTLDSGEEFAQKINMINDYNPDIVVLAGDFVDDNSPYEDTKTAAEALGNLKTKYGVYYTFGNHDKGYSGSSSRGYDAEGLTKLLTENGIKVMQDDIVYPCEGYALIGRKDRSSEGNSTKNNSVEDKTDNGRLSASKLLSQIDKNIYSVVIDHQPGDYKNEAAAGADLVLSGHTHGGQMIPITWVGVWLGMNDSVYGLKHMENTDFITTSGISDWEIHFKTGCKSEIVIIDLKNSDE